MTNSRRRTPTCVAARPAPSGIVHQLGHPLDELVEVVVEGLDLVRPHAKHGIGVLADLRERDEPPGIALGIGARPRPPRLVDVGRSPRRQCTPALQPPAGPPHASSGFSVRRVVLTCRCDSFVPVATLDLEALRIDVDRPPSKPAAAHRRRRSRQQRPACAATCRGDRSSRSAARGGGRGAAAGRQARASSLGSRDSQLRRARAACDAEVRPETSTRTRCPNGG